MLLAFGLAVLAGLSTAIGGLIVLLFKEPKREHLNIAMGFSAGVMIFVSFVELLGGSIRMIGYIPAIIAFFLGIVIIYLVDVFIPHYYEEEQFCDPKKKARIDLKRCGVLTTVGIAIHNFPEGIAVFFAAMTDIRLGFTIAFAIALHNIPEGIAIAMPLYHSTKNKMTAFLYSLVAGLAEPVGALLAFLLLTQFMNDYLLYVIIAASGGIMVFISFDELLPRAFSQENIHKIIFGIFAGMAIMAFSLALF